MELVGLKITSDNIANKKRILTFVILEEEKTKAIETLVSCIDSGSIVTLADNRNKREGAISIKKENDLYFKSGGGHGFSIDWTTVTLKDACWLINVTAPFNYVGIDNGSIEITE